MENATKALLIAGGVLIVILIIGVGMTIFNAGGSAIESGTATAEAQGVDIFNGQFDTFQGLQKGSAVKTLLSKIISSNASNTGTGHIIRVTTTTSGGSGGTVVGGWAARNNISVANGNNSLSTIRNSVTNQHTFKVDMEYGTNGYINNITIRW